MTIKKISKIIIKNTKDEFWCLEMIVEKRHIKKINSRKKALVRRDFLNVIAPKYNIIHT